LSLNIKCKNPSIKGQRIVTRIICNIRRICESNKYCICRWSIDNAFIRGCVQ